VLSSLHSRSTCSTRSTHSLAYLARSVETAEELLTGGGMTRNPPVRMFSSVRHHEGFLSCWTMAVTRDDPGQRPRSEGQAFRDRLSHIPHADEVPIEGGWQPADSGGADRPPVVRRQAPVARPAARPDPHGHQAEHQQRQAPQQRGHYREDAADAFFDGDEQRVDADGEWPIGARKRRRWPLVLFGLLIIAGLIVIIPLFRARQVFNSIERTEVSDVLTPPPVDGVNIMLVGTDSRDGIDGSTENAGLIIGTEVGEGPITGERTDTMMILRLQEDGTAKFLSLPRDLWLPIDGGEPQRINTAFRGGPTSLVNTVQRELDVPISHYVQVDLVGFIALVDAVGGVEISIPHPAFDTRSGLDLPTAGPNVLDSTQALAYVRSRFYTERINGEEVRDGTSDLGRVQRQQSFMRALLRTVSEQRDPRVLDSMATSMAAAIVIDDATSLTDAASIANKIRTTTPESVVLPTRPANIGGRDVLELTEEAPAVLAQFGSGAGASMDG